MDRRREMAAHLDKNVIDHMWFGFTDDDELLPVEECACGATFQPWEWYISIYRDMAYPCPKCGHKFYWGDGGVWEITENMVDTQNG
jgi:hypothetical protein